MVQPICILVTTAFYETLNPFTHVATDIKGMHAAFSLRIRAHGSDVISQLIWLCETVEDWL